MKKPSPQKEPPKREEVAIFIKEQKLLDKSIDIITRNGGRIMHQFNRLLIADFRTYQSAILKRLPVVAILLHLEKGPHASFDKSERLGWKAYQKRHDKSFVRVPFRPAKTNPLWRSDPRDRERPPYYVPPKNGVGNGADDKILPVPPRLINKNAVALIIVDGVQADRQISESEKVNIVSELQEALSWIDDQRPSANLTWAYETYEAQVDITPWEGALLKGMPDTWYDGWDASVYNERDGKLYLFRVHEYIRFSDINDDMDSGYPKRTVDEWNNWPSTWTSGIDAALWREEDQKIYFFKGNDYVIANPNTLTVETTPDAIVNGWFDLPVGFQGNIDFALGDKITNKVYFFKGDQYLSFAPGSTTKEAGSPKSIAGNWQNMPSTFALGMDSGFSYRDKIYLFLNDIHGATYVRLSVHDLVVEDDYRIGNVHVGLSTKEAEAVWRDPALQQFNYPVGEEGEKRLAADLKADTNADYAIIIYVTKQPVTHIAYAGRHRVVFSSNNLTGSFAVVLAHETLHLYGAADEYFSGDPCDVEYGRFFQALNGNSVSCLQDVVPCLMDDTVWALCDFTHLHIGWGAFEEQIDAAVYRGDNDKTYLFSKNYYIRYSKISNGRDDDYPRLISRAWKGLPNSFEQGIDAALWREDNKALYFFKGDQYVRFSSGKTSVDPNYPKSIAGRWKNIPPEFEQGIDAALWYQDTGKIYFFKGNQLVRLSIINGAPTMDEGYPQPISATWRATAYGFDEGINAALMRWDTKQVYLFREEMYVRFSGRPTSGPDANYPAWINGNWMPFPKKNYRMT